MTKTCNATLKALPSARPALAAVAALFSVLTAAPAAQAQSAGYDTSLRSIAPATIHQANFDVRTRSPIQSIGPASVENRATMVPAVYDPSLGRFVSASSPSRGAISVSSSSVTSVIVSGQNSTFVVGSAASSGPQRTEGLNAPTATLASLQVVATPASSNR